ncbi:MAG TPA: amino acid permease [Flavobacteriales bacterium]|nr:amino acid permease [Flavobacteriales bacterium]
MSKLFRKKTIDQILKEGAVDGHGSGLARTLGARDLIAFGIAAIIGAGIFSTIGGACAKGGPGVIFLFIFTGIACSFAAFAYAEFASRVPVSGSAYTYSYVAFGELFAWIIGWALIMEYAIGNIVVAVSWSSYFNSMLDGSFGWHVPYWLSYDYFTAQNGFNAVNAMLAKGTSLQEMATNDVLGMKAALQQWTAWNTAPMIGSIRLIFNLPALIIIGIITWLVYRGMKESKLATNIMVGIKLVVVLMVIVVGVNYINGDNYSNFMPNGMSGVLAGVSGVFFAYIGFDAISTTAEECKDPQRDLPKGILYSILICTILYILIALVLTGMMHYKALDTPDPLSTVFKEYPSLFWLQRIVEISAVVALASVLLVFQMGQPRIWLAMSRDGLLPKKFSNIHPRFKTPGFATIVTGFVVAVPTLFLPSSTVENLCSIGTLFAFILVCAGVLKFGKPVKEPGKFRTPYVNARYVMPVIFVFVVVLLTTNAISEESHVWFNDFITFTSDNWMDRIPMVLFFLVFVISTVLAVTKSYSLIPLLGMISCFYMMAQIAFSHWIGFIIWLIAGLLIYFLYSRNNSRLNDIV